jgi:cysteine desulfurase family protein
MNVKTAVYAEEPEIIYLDNAATTWPKPDSVYEFANEFYRRYGGNAGRGNNPLARACARLLDETRHKVADWLDAPTPEQLVFTSSATHALNLAIFGHKFRSGDVIYVSPFEHNSVLRPVEQLRRTQGIQVRQIPFNRRTYACKLEKLEAAFQIEPPTMVCVTQASNVCGLMPPVVEIARLAKKAAPNAVIVVDAAQTAGLYPLLSSDGLIDALIFSGHKSLYALYGIAGLVLGSDWRPKPLLFGGTGTLSESVEMPTALPFSYEAGSHNILAIAGLSAAVDWLQAIGREKIVETTLASARQIQQELKDYSQIELFNPNGNNAWCGILSFTIESTSPQMVENILGSQGIAVRAGFHCAPWAHRWLKTNDLGGTLRVSSGFFNNKSEADKFLYSVKAIV